MATQNAYLLEFSFNSKTRVEYKAMKHQLRVHQHLRTRRLNRCDEDYAHEKQKLKMML
jgi:hypothetical protein